MNQTEFIKSLDFMKLGQAIHHNQWESAMFAVRRLEKNAKDCELPQFSRLLFSLQHTIQRKDIYECKQILTQISARRAQYLNQLNQTNPPTFPSY